jgi:hypothetical protein
MSSSGRPPLIESKFTSCNMSRNKLLYNYKGALGEKSDKCVISAGEKTNGNKERFSDVFACKHKAPQNVNTA